MNMISLHAVSTDRSNLLTRGKLPELSPIYQERPAIKPPRSASRQHSDSELSTAAAMLAKLRLRHDVVDHLRSNPQPIIYDREKTIDKVVDHLLRHLL
jgi:hypothetical protein